MLFIKSCLSFVKIVCNAKNYILLKQKIIVKDNSENKKMKDSKRKAETKKWIRKDYQWEEKR